MRSSWEFNFSFCFIFVIIYLYGCNSKKEATSELRINVVHEFRLSEETQEYLYQLYPSVVASPHSEELAFSNLMSPYRVVFTDYDGSYLGQVGKYGRGPNEIQSASRYGYDGSVRLVILDLVSSAFKVHDRVNGSVLSYNIRPEPGLTIASRNLEKCGDYWYLAINEWGRPPAPDVPIVGVFDANFDLIETFGGYDPYFQGEPDVLRETRIKLDCENMLAFVFHSKTPFIQVYSLINKQLKTRTTVKPPSFLLSEKSIGLVSNMREFTRYMSEEQSLSLVVAISNDHIYHVFRNMHADVNSNAFRFHQYDHFAVVYERDSMNYLGEVSLPGAVLGSTKEGYLIILSNEETYELKLIKIEVE